MRNKGASSTETSWFFPENWACDFVSEMPKTTCWVLPVNVLGLSLVSLCQRGTPLLESWETIRLRSSEVNWTLPRNSSCDFRAPVDQNHMPSLYRSACRDFHLFRNHRFRKVGKQTQGSEAPTLQDKSDPWGKSSCGFRIPGEENHMPSFTNGALGTFSCFATTPLPKVGKQLEGVRGSNALRPSGPCRKFVMWFWDTWHPKTTCWILPVYRSGLSLVSQLSPHGKLGNNPRIRGSDPPRQGGPLRKFVMWF